MSDNEKNKLPDLTEQEVKPTIFDAPENYTESQLDSVMQRVRAKRIDANKPLPEPELLMGMGNAPILRRGSLCFVCGQAGSRKTSALTLICADMMKPSHIPNSPFTIPRPLKILYIDPEQHEGDTQRINIRIKSLIGSDESIDTYPLIEFPTDLIPYIIEQLLRDGNYDICVIDNVAQMGKGIIMDIDKAEELVRNLRRLAVTYNCGFFGVIHMNEGAKTNRPRGHGGAEAVREGDLVWQFIEDSGKDFSVAEALKARLLKPQKWAISIDERGLPYYHDAIPTSPQLPNSDKYATIVEKIPINGMSYAELQKLISDTSGVALSTAKSWITTMDKNKVVDKILGRYYKPNTKIVEDDSLPF